MGDSELSLVRFSVINFFAVIMQTRPFQPISTLLIKLVEALISAEPEPDIKMQKRLNWIYDNTHIKVEIPLSIVELAVFKNLDRGLNRELEIFDKTFNLVELYRYLDEISKELTTMVVQISRKYSLDIPMSVYGSKGTQTIGISDD